MNDEYIWPIEPKYKVTEHDKYGIRKNHYVLFKERQHSGFDITADIGTEVHSIANGTVILAEFDGTTTEGFDSFNDGYGNKVEILNDDGRRVVYGHLRKYFVKPGDIITKNTVIGLTGSSGGSRVPHLHIEIRKENTEETGLEYTINPLDVLPKIDLEKLTEEFKLEPYAKLWRIMASNKPWDFTPEDIPYSEDKEYIR
ncbi:MAG: M23 family metallopeptidase [Clostridia bacterium]|nr:M23 family metallopeptidase [Clostridia bacterium]